VDAFEFLLSLSPGRTSASDEAVRAAHRAMLTLDLERHRESAVLQVPAPRARSPHAA
jgi:hypothetical protein